MAIPTDPLLPKTSVFLLINVTLLSIHSFLQQPCLMSAHHLSCPMMQECVNGYCTDINFDPVFDLECRHLNCPCELFANWDQCDICLECKHSGFDSGSCQPVDNCVWFHCILLLFQWGEGVLILFGLINIFEQQHALPKKFPKLPPQQ